MTHKAVPITTVEITSSLFVKDWQKLDDENTKDGTCSSKFPA
jgi:hypothetical protein